MQADGRLGPRDVPVGPEKVVGLREGADLLVKGVECGGEFRFQERRQRLQGLAGCLVELDEIESAFDRIFFAHKIGLEKKCVKYEPNVMANDNLRLKRRAERSLRKGNRECLLNQNR